MKKSFVLMDLECAHCGAKMEQAISRLEGVNQVSVNFLAQRLTLDAQDDKFAAVVEEAAKICKKIEPDCRLIVK